MFDWVENGSLAKDLKFSKQNESSLKKVLWEISENPQENICAEISFVIK